MFFIPNKPENMLFCPFIQAIRWYLLGLFPDPLRTAPPLQGAFHNQVIKNFANLLSVE